MADSRHALRVFLLDPDERGILPLETFHTPRRLRRTVRQDTYQVRVDTAFSAVVSACAASRPGREDTWINDRIETLYRALHDRGEAHSVEAWSVEGEAETLVGGLYGVRLGAAFFGESMFSTARDASKVALVHLAARLKVGGFKLLDAQFITDHLRQFGAIEISRTAYHARLKPAIGAEADFWAIPHTLSGEEALAALA